MIHTAIILCGGLGTRLRGVVDDLPKSMAPVSGKPFLYYQMKYLKREKINHVILACGFKHESIQEYFGDRFEDIGISYSIENSPLGTGGALRNALELSLEDEAIVLNGDSFFPIRLQHFFSEHQKAGAQISIALKPMSDVERFGMVTTDANHRIIAFEEKGSARDGNINGGIYIVKKNLFHSFQFPESFSFEKDFMEKNLASLRCCGFVYRDYFIDIGIPEDFKTAQLELPLYGS